MSLTSAGRADLLLLFSFLSIFNSKKLLLYFMVHYILQKPFLRMDLEICSLETEVHCVKRCHCSSTLKGIETGLVSLKAVVNLPQSVASFSVLAALLFI